MSKKRWVYISILLVVMVLLTNYTPLKGLLDLKHVYHYSTLQGELQTAERPFKGCNYGCVEMVLEEYKRQYPQSGDTILYRTFKRNPLIFWRWHDYVFHPRYKLPYLNPQHVTQVNR
jgi:hypothetical protein